MDLGAFSISLTVKDIEASKNFYESLGFESLGGDCGQGWTILKNGDHIIGLFQGMFDKNMLTFNPGWDQSAQNTDAFTDVRELREALVQRGITIVNDGATGDSGPGSIVIEDPDGNPILIDQHR
ncbi:VOC family protein [Microbulbifer sp. CAU 1566]|uniref:VOC family protein n=1 Tax=Microbulbifer sp. CAU 1566 TaxID=2933269 RepID=UPI002006B9DD|nr:VOC family protein [Microbulbifer sp. CAU 1566]MCK7598616.1 VOC family protein [Microbulbifer sp. CAU 1566]